MSQKNGLMSAIGAIDSALKTQELAATLRPHMAKVHWAQIVGPQVSAVTQVEAVRASNTSGKHILVVRVRNSVWANELTFLKEDILRRLNRTLGGQVLVDIHFKASGLARAKNKTQGSIRTRPTLPEQDDLAQVELSGEALLRIQKTVQGITDLALQARVRSTLTRAAQLTAWKHQNGWLSCTQCGTLSLPLASENSADLHLCPFCRLQQTAV